MPHPTLPGRGTPSWGAASWGDGPPPWTQHGWGGPPWVRRPRTPPRWVTLWVPVVLAFLMHVPPALFFARVATMNGAATLTQAATWVGLALLGPLLLIGARRFPGPVAAAVAVAAAVDLFLGDPTGRPYFALAFAIVGGIVRGARLWVFISLAACWVGSIALALALGADWPPWRIAVATIGIILAIGVGEFIRNRRDRSREFREEWSRREQREVQAERVRIARELHDVLAHSLSQINVQAGVALHLIERQPDGAATALASIKETSRTALEEVRSVLGVLRAEDGADPSAPLVPEPDLARLAGLAASVTEQGVEVRLDDRVSTLDPAPPTNVQLALYRIVQESLTNVLRHASAATVQVVLEADDHRYLVSVRDDGTGATARRGADGRGLLGMRERAELLGGTLTAGPVSSGAGSPTAGPSGGFEVVATIPIRRRASEDQR